ncbi:uncharacterized protein LOC125860632 isoform X1 [Solanum stenotomum]|uniref:uncharacterized protein LOC125860632 isoform X1 n=2 Tax=Solanum stenotomum TaxID=172797 RepID=UPI0020D101AD|nr:uncharacterized protein LOC125860632 isoform X1 [Solanum stenotomum]XP_049396586.1 uncharacterized protein LOC125860632 isoform X1 [Solanum stenotomum]
MGAEGSLEKLNKKKKSKKNKEGRAIFLQKEEEKLAKAMEEKKRKKKRAHVLTRRRDEVHLSNYKDNVDGEKENKSAKRKMRKDVKLDETESLEIDQSNEREDALGQENNVSAEKRKSRKKKRKCEKKVRRNETVDHYVEANDDSDQKSEKDHSLTITQDNLVEKRGQAGYEEIDELSSGDEDCSKGMRKWVLDYYQSRPGLKVLQERIDEFITSYEAKKEQERKEKEALAAEDGWTVVVHHKGRKKTTDSETGIAVGSVSQAAVMDNMDKKKKKDVGLDFYRFQKREAKRNEIMVLQSKFEQDKKRIQQLRAARKFRPY